MIGQCCWRKRAWLLEARDSTGREPQGERRIRQALEFEALVPAACDLVLGVGGSDLDDKDQFMGVLRTSPVGEPLALAVQRGSEPLKLSATPEAFTDASALAVARDRWGIEVRAGRGVAVGGAVGVGVGVGGSWRLMAGR